VLAIHDTSTFRVTDDAELDSFIQTGKRGFLAHVSLLVDPRFGGNPLGVAATEILTRPKVQRRTQKNGRRMTGADTAKLKNRESQRWSRAVRAVEDRSSDVALIHVMDREGDSYELVAELIGKGCSFVIRRCKERRARLSDQDSPTWQTLNDVLDRATPTLLTRDVHVGKRKAKSAPGANKAKPARPARAARLRVARCKVELKKPRYLHLADGYPPSLALNIVRVYEPHPPRGQEPVEWVLMSDLPIEDDGDVERIIDIYRQRWLIEEFFKALKTGCGYRTRRLTNANSILNSFALFAPIASKALAIRSLAQRSDQPAELVLTPCELRVLHAKAPSLRIPLAQRPSVADVLPLVARMGGHRRSSGPPGWLTLMRGTEKLQNLAEGWALAMAEM
jgi:hypothetical protein